MRHINRQKVAKFRNLTLKYVFDLLTLKKTLKMTSGAVKMTQSNSPSSKTLIMDPEIISLALLEVTLAHNSS